MKVTLERVVLAALLVLLMPFTSLASDDAAVQETEIVGPNMVRVTVATTYQSDHGEEVIVLLRVLPEHQAQAFEVSPRFVKVRRGQGEATFTVRWNGQGQAVVRQLGARLAEARPGAGLSPFFTATLDVEWTFPLAAVSVKVAPAPAPASVAGQVRPPATPPAAAVTPDKRQRPPGAQVTGRPIDSGASAEDQRNLQHTIADVQRQKGLSAERAMGEREVKRELMLRMPVSQERAATLGLTIAVNVPDHTAPPGSRAVRPGEQGSTEVGERADPGGPRVDELAIVSVEKPHRGTYRVHFSYHIRDVDGRTPITFDCRFDEDQVAQWVAQTPWLHESPTRDHRGSGVITLWIDTVEAPISLGKAGFRLRARGNGGQLYASIHLRPLFNWYKSYDTITRANIQSFMDDPSFPAVSSIDVNEGADSLAEKMHDFENEPVMLVLRTATGACCRGLFKPYRGAQGLEGVWVLDLDCFAGAGPTILDGHIPADDADRALSRRSYDSAGLLAEGRNFDLDFYGLAGKAEDADLVVKVDGVHRLKAKNGCQIKY